MSDLIFFDIETVPENPENIIIEFEQKHPDLFALTEFVDNGEEMIKWTEAKHPRTKGDALIKKSAEYSEKYHSDLDSIKLSHSIDPLKARVLCVVFGAEHNPGLHAVAANKNIDETDMLKLFWKHMSSHFNFNIAFAGFNIFNFDLPFLFLRSAKHGLDTGIFSLTNFQKYKRDNMIDLMQILGNYNNKYRSQAAYCDFFGIENEKDMDGSKVFQMYQDGKIAEIIEYCKRDVRRDMEIYKRIKGVIL